MAKPKRKVRGGTCWAVIDRESTSIVHATGDSQKEARRWYVKAYGCPPDTKNTCARIRWRELPTPRARKAKR